MRILLQHVITGLYLTEVGGWTRSGDEALDFVSSSSALDFCRGNRMTDVQLVLKFQEQQYDIVLPVLADHVEQVRTAPGP